MHKILQVTTVATTLKSFLLPYAKFLKNKGWIVHAASDYIEKYPEIKDTHDEIFPINFSRNPKNIFRIFNSFIQIRKLIINESYDIVHVHTPIASFITRFACIGLNTKIVYTAHGFHFMQSKKGFKNFIFLMLEKIAGKFTDYLIVINKEDYDTVLKYKIIPYNKVSLINGIGINMTHYSFNPTSRYRIRKELGISDQEIILLQIAELNTNKNHLIIIESLIALNDPTIKYIVLGDGPMKKELKKLCKGKSIEKNIYFLGYSNTINEYLSASDIVVLSSKREGLPRCIMEAMAAKRPVIASNIRGCRDLLQDNSAFLIEPDDKEAWVNSIRTLSKDVNLRKRIGEEGYEHLKTHCEESLILNRVFDIYCLALGISTYGK